MTFGEPTRLDPISVAWNTVASFGSYEEAQKAVDQLSDDGFAVENLDIVGSDLRLVERVTGRMTKRREAEELWQDSGAARLVERSARVGEGK